MHQFATVCWLLRYFSSLDAELWPKIVVSRIMYDWRFCWADDVCVCFMCENINELLCLFTL